ncbi:hypothetical protein IQ266_15235 [filamentous cyanobacterium LEGE 11480]|uniref:Uncharacterized protein n=1 Tax=Romeriopsis navalis LEGE 11480 TaxID=2777977 RepID=A0A928VR95_9CYAN|nr:hypothetical protein [Romeriopsis navalis]MBE9031087.1 hypothetical protein [Romeriopsis navalis LEGE 11480]
MNKSSRTKITLASLLVLYLFGYAVARLSLFHTVENYAGGKGGTRQDYIAKKDRPAGKGWEYQLFLPAIKLEEGISYFFNNLL